MNTEITGQTSETAAAPLIQTLFMGDCLEEMKKIPDGSVDMVMCDLPYGTTACKWDSVIPFAPLWAQYRRVCKRNAAIVLTASQPFTSALVMSNADAFRYCWIWEKNRPTGFLDAKKKPLRAHEDVVVFYQEQPTYNPQKTKGEANHCTGVKSGKKAVGKSDIFAGEFGRVPADKSGDKYPRSVQRFNGLNPTGDNRTHPTQKPVALVEYLIRTYTTEGQTVLDNTMGSGTTGVACVNTNRHFIGIERDPNYFQIAKDRIQAAGVAKSQRAVEDQSP
jgi:site-specific DNA-methyltransferase (adenine-specific)